MIFPSNISSLHKNLRSSSDCGRSTPLEHSCVLSSLWSLRYSQLWELNIIIKELSGVFPSALFLCGDGSDFDDGDVFSSDSVFGSEFHI